MHSITKDNKIEFFKFLSREVSAEEIENFIYTQSDLEQQIGSENYFNLISVNFKDKYDIVKLSRIIKTKIIDEGEYETWKLKELLKNFLKQPEKLDVFLNIFYHLYCGNYQDNDKVKFKYKFLGVLGLNYLFWTEEYYLKENFGKNWEVQYEIYKVDFKFYHEQLKVFALEILEALDLNEILIFNNGSYQISDKLKNKFETSNIFTLKHPK